METAEVPIPTLDDYCLQHIFSFLDIVDKIQVARSCSYFDEIIGRLMAIDLFDFNRMYEMFPLSEAVKIFVKYGSKIRSIFMQFDAVDDMVEYYYLVPTYCPNIHKIQFNFPYYVDTEIMEMMFKTSKHVKNLFCNARELMDDHCRLISKLIELESLNIEENRYVTGLHLNKLTRLKNLNLQGCSELESNHFIEICKATKLKSLNIIECELLDTTAFETILATQSELEKLELSLFYPAGNTAFVTRLKNLKHVGIQCHIQGKPDVQTDLLKLLAEYHHDTLETLNFYRPAPQVKLDRESILKFKNLLNVAFIADEDLDDGFLVDLSKNCPNLKKVDLSESRNVTEGAIVQFVTNLKQLRVLDLRRCGQLGETLLSKLIGVLTGNEDRQCLTLYVWGTKIEERNAKVSQMCTEARKYISVSYKFKY